MKSIHASLTLISKVIKGVLLPDAKIIETAQALMIHQVSPPPWRQPSENNTFQTPPLWDQLWPGPADPITYLEALVYKAKATQTLAETPNSSSLLSGPVNLFNLFRPSVLLNAFRQLVARAKKQSMDNLKFVNSWKSSDFATEPMTLQISPLQIQGAIFDGVLRPVAPNSSPFSHAPSVYIGWVEMVSLLV